MENNKKIKKLTIDVTEEEKQLIKEKAKAARMSMKQYILKCVEEKEIYAFNELMDFVVALNKAGNNLNQIAKIANTQRYVSKEVVENIREAKKVFDSSNEQIKEMMSKMFE